MLSSKAVAGTRSHYDKYDCKIIEKNEAKYLQNNNISKGGKNIGTEKAKDYDILSHDQYENKEKESYYFGQPLIWKNIFFITMYHVIAVYAYLTFPYIQRWKTAVCAFICTVIGSFGVTAGVHRLWTHRSYKAKLPLRIILACFYYSAGMNSIFNWVRDHRVHHKFSETNADPHNSKRGFFFSHVGWLMMRKNPDVLKKGRQIDMTDITSDPVIAFGDKYFSAMKIFFFLVLPPIIPIFLWNEDWYYAIMAQIFMRYAFILNGTWSVNSLAHMYGKKPFDKTIAPAENAFVAWASGGEGWHNYHHAFPWDYKASEYGFYLTDLSTLFINTMAKIGWAYDMKEVSCALVKSTVAKKGDGSYVKTFAQSNDCK